MSELEHFRLKSSDLGRLTGVSIAVHAIPDGFLLMHCGVGCKHKATSKLSTHDWGRSVVDREGWTEVGDAELIEGSADRIGPYLRTWQARLEPGLMVCISVTFLDLTGDDFKDAVRECDDELPCDVVFVPAAGTAGDHHEGYGNVVVEIAKKMDWTAPTKPKQVSVLGYFFDRYEGDHAGNLAQLKALLKALGLELGPVLFSGTPLAGLKRAPESGILLGFPHVHKRLKRLKRICKRAPTPVDLPMGIAGTSRWLREVGAAAGVDPARVEAVTRHKLAIVESKLGFARQALAGNRVAVFADLPLAAGLIGVLRDLGMVPAVVGIRGHTLGGADALRMLVAKDGPELNCPVLEDPSIHAVREIVGDGLREGIIDGICGSATDFNGITTLPASTFENAPFALEVGFPCKRWHVVRPTPTLGYAGVLAWADRFLSAPRLWDDGR